LLPDNAQPVSASAIAISGNDAGGNPHQVPRALETKEIPDLINEYVKAAENAIEAGFDGVEIHGANGYIIDQFINTNSNKRTDQYGGSIENRTRLALEVVDAVQKTIGADRTAIRFSPWGKFQDMGDDTPQETWGYLTQQLQDNHPDLAYVHFMEPRTTLEDSVGTSEHTLNHFRNIWKSVFVTAGGFGHDLPGALKHAEESGDMIAFGRQFIANPDLPDRIQQQLPLNPYNRATFYSNGSEGYTDYPTYEEAQPAQVTTVSA
jgi:2,4-dienoyl-CoA reductase-like NADH-dependent reductase (Old Yellow Enzyme family)